MNDSPARSYILGRGKDCDVDLADGSVSRPHATLQIGGDGSLHLADFPSKLGTFVFRDGRWRQIEAAAVGRDEPVMFGEHRTTLGRVLERIDRGVKGQTTDDDDPPETKRHVAVIVADVVGYSKGMSQEPSGTLAALKAARRDVVDPHILLHGGRIFGEAGDAVCAEFRDGASAVRAANQIQQQVGSRTFGPQNKALKLRIGIHAGEVIVRQENLFGSPVNIAARLQTLATPGRICISALIRAQLGEAPAVALIDLGEKALKNIPDPIRVYEIDIADG